MTISKDQQDHLFSLVSSTLSLYDSLNNSSLTQTFINTLEQNIENIILSDKVYNFGYIKIDFDGSILIYSIFTIYNTGLIDIPCFVDINRYNPDCSINHYNFTNAPENTTVFTITDFIYQSNRSIQVQIFVWCSHCEICESHQKTRINNFLNEVFITGFDISLIEKYQGFPKYDNSDYVLSL